MRARSTLDWSQSNNVSCVFLQYMRTPAIDKCKLSASLQRYVSLCSKQYKESMATV